MGEYDHEARKIRKEGVAPMPEAPSKDKKKKKKKKKSKNSDSDDGLLPYHGEMKWRDNGKPKDFDKSENKTSTAPPADANISISERLARARNQELEKSGGKGGDRFERERDSFRDKDR